MYNIESATRLDGQTIVIPTGYHILVSMPQVEEKTAGGLYMPDEHVSRESFASILGYVVAMGPDAFSDKERFPSGPYCKVGDWIIFRSYSGTKVKLDDAELRLINDDTVDAVVSDPRKVQRA